MKEKKSLNGFIAVRLCTFLVILCKVFSSCSEDSEPKYVPLYSLNSIYGFTFTTTFTSSSGNTLSPAITIYNSDRLDWNMSLSNMGNNKFYYTAEQDPFLGNVWTLCWYSTLMAKEAGDSSKAAMKIKLGINSQDSISVLVIAAGAGAGSSMAGTPLSMKRISYSYNTTPEVISESNENIKDKTIEIKGEKSDWFEEKSSFSGSYDFLVGEDGIIAKDHVETDGNSEFCVFIQNSGNGNVSVTVPSMSYGGFELPAFTIDEVSVSEFDGVFYLSKGTFNVSSGSYAINGISLSGEYSKGLLSLRYVFAPGKMPFPITVIYVSSRKK